MWNPERGVDKGCLPRAFLRRFICLHTALYAGHEGGLLRRLKSCTKSVYLPVYRLAKFGVSP